MLTEKQIYRMVLKEYPDILDIKPLSVILEVSMKTAYKLVRNGTIACIKVGREYRVPKINVIKHLFASRGHSDNTA